MGPAILIGIIGVPVILFTLLRVNAAIVFLSICLGDVLVQYMASDAVSLMTTFMPSLHMDAGTAKLILLGIPVILTILIMIKSLRGSKVIFNILPAAGCGVLLALIAVPLLPPGTAATIMVSPIWNQVMRLQDLLVGASALLCLLNLLMQRPKHVSEPEKRHH
jgi:hypothetical protein